MESAIRPIADLRARVWGGTRLGTVVDGTPIGESWVAGPASGIAHENATTLDELAAALGIGLVGSASPWPDRFPLLVKILDPDAWLSVQVHPDDALARRLAGPDAVGKTEAWVVLDAAPGASVLVGIRDGVGDTRVRRAIRDGGLPDLLRRLAVVTGDAILLPAGTIHAVGPGMLLYEVQQPSDLTYRADDWGRAPTPWRPLHTAEALEAWQPQVRPVIGRADLGRPGTIVTVVACAQFVIERAEAPVGLATRGLTPHVITALPGSSLVIAGEGWSETLEAYETIVVPAAAVPYRIDTRTRGGGSCLVARLPT